MAPSDKKNTPNDDLSSPSDSSSSSRKPSPSKSQPFRHKANAPYSPYPPFSTHEYPPRTQPAPRTSEDGASPDSKSSSPLPALTLQTMLPNIVTLSGRPSYPPYAPNQNDERCIIYCTQTAMRRSVGQQPICKTWCWRRLFPQDYRTDAGTLSPPKSRDAAIPVASTSSSKYQTSESSSSTSPSSSSTTTTQVIGSQEITTTVTTVNEEGRRTVITRRTVSTSNKSKNGAPSSPPQTSLVDKPDPSNSNTISNFFDFDGRYVYFGKSRFRARDRLESMSRTGLSQDYTVDEIMKKEAERTGGKDRAKKLDNPKYMDFLKNYHNSTQIPLQPLPSELYSSLSTNLSRIFSPAQKYIESFEAGGAQEKFAKRLWDKTKDGEALNLMKGAGNALWEAIRNGNGKGGDGGKGGTGDAS